MKKNNELMWPYTLFGIECSEGWRSLYQPLIDYVEKYNSEHTDSHIEIHQIKEKFGGLRFYWGGENLSKETQNEFSNMISDAAAESWIVCEECGSREDVGLTIRGWYSTVCKNCLLKRAQRNNMDYLWLYDNKKYIVNKEGINECIK